jgi:FecR protein
MKMEFRAIVAAALSACLFLPGGTVFAFGSTRDGARVTVIAKDVTLLSPQGEAGPAVMDESLSTGATVQTGADSRAELTFANQAIARLWSNSALHLERGARNMELRNGVVFLDVPRGVKARIHAAGVAVAASGATTMFEYHDNVFKFLVLQGTGRLYRPHHLGDSVLVRPGQMVIGNPKRPLSDPVDFDIGGFLKTSRFIRDFAALRDQKLMVAASEKQQRQKSKKVLLDTNLVIFGGGTLVSVVDPSADPVAMARPPVAAPTTKTVKKP